MGGEVNKTRTVLYSRDTVRVYIRYAYIYAVFSNTAMYDGNPLNLDRLLEKLDDWGMTVTEDMDPADAERYVFKRFRYRLPEVLQEL